MGVHRSGVTATAEVDAKVSLAGPEGDTLDAAFRCRSSFIEPDLQDSRFILVLAKIVFVAPFLNSAERIEKLEVAISYKCDSSAKAST